MNGELTSFIRKISLLLIIIGLSISSTVHAATPAPGGVDTSLQLWLTATAGVSTTTNGASVDSWNDQSGGGRHVSQTTTKRPTLNLGSAANAINFNPSLSFASSSNQFLETTAQDVLASDSAYTIFTVFQLAGTTTSKWIIGGGEATSTYAISITSNSDRPNIYHGATQLSGTTGVLGLKPGMVTTRYAGGGGASFISTSGIYRTQPTTATYVGGTTLEIGNRVGGSSASMSGQIAEVAVYNRELTYTEMQKVQSALALKYGISYRGQDYLSSGGTTYYSTSTNSGYTEEVFGIGKDTNAGVDQRVSRSVGTSTVMMTVATIQDFASANSDSGRTALSDGSFMMLGNNASSTSFGSRYNGVASKRMNRVWRVQETGTVGSVYVAIPNTVSFPSGTKKVIVSSDTVFTSHDTVVTLSDDGTYYYAQINPSDGQYISFISDDGATVSCTSYDNVFHPSCATTAYLSQYDTDRATGNWLTPRGDAGTATYTAHNVTELATYINTLQAGDILELANGTWSDEIDLEFTTAGTAQNPITIRPQNPGGVTFTGPVQFFFIGDYTSFEGFKFEGEYTHPDTGNNIININMGRTGATCNHCLVHNVTFDNYVPSDPSERSHRVRSAGVWNTVASSTFIGKDDSGVEIVLFDNGNGTSTPKDYLLIQGNYFYDRTENISNGYEALRMGDSTISRRESRSYVLDNLFEDYTGETELVSLKKDNITVRGNTFINSGHVPVVFRQSSSSTVEANIIDGENVPEKGGVRVNGSGHSVIHNVFQNLDSTGHTSSYTPLTLYKGQDFGGGSDYLPVTNFNYGFNTLYNNVTTGYSAGTPSGLTVPVWPTSSNYMFNVAASNVATAAYTIDASSTITFAGNTFNGTTIGLSNTSGFSTTNAQLTSHDGVYYSDLASLDFTRKPYRAYYAEMGLSTTTLFRMQYVNSAPESTITLTKLTSALTGAHYDSDVPVISSITADSPESTAINISWTTDEAATSKVVYGVTSSYGSETALSSTLVTSHTVAITGLNAATTYHFAVVSADALGNTSTSSDQVVQTTVVGKSASNNKSGRTRTVTTSVIPNSSVVSPVVSGSSVGSLTTYLSLGDQGTEVTKLQSLLATDAALYPDAKITGFYGPLTAAAVGRFQIRYGIATQGATGFGRVGPNTLAKLNEVFATGTTQPIVTPSVPVTTTSALTPSSSIGGVDLTLGAEGTTVTALQSFLVAQNAGPAASALKAKGTTGYFGTFTQEALKEYQLSVGIAPATGYFGPKTRAYLAAKGLSL